MTTVENILKAWVSLFKEHTTLFFLELKLARISIIPLCFCLIILVITSTGLWLLFMGLLFYSSWYLGLNVFLSFASVILFNLLIIGIIGFFIFRYMGNIRFKHTRKQLHNYYIEKEKYESNQKTPATN